MRVWTWHLRRRGSSLRALGVGIAIIAGVAVMSVEGRQSVPPGAPLTLTAAVTNTTVTFRWVANPSGSAPELYQLHAGTAPGLSNIAIVSVPAATTSFVATAPPGTYYVRVTAANTFGASAPSNEVVITVGGGSCLLPGVPSGLAATTSSGGVTLRWNAPTTGGVPTRYMLVVGSVAGGANIGTFDVGAATTLTAPAPAGQYFVRVMAANACGNSAPGAEISFVIGAPAPAGTVPAGIYDGTMFNHTRVTPGRRAITSFTLRLNEPVPTVGLRQISAQWSDNAGCVQSQGIFGGRSTSGFFSVSIEHLRCNGDSEGVDLSLIIRSISGNTYEGTCPLGGAACTFRMVRR